LRRHPFEDNFFEGAVCEDFIEHLTEDKALFFLREVHRTMLPDGVITISTPAWNKIIHVIKFGHKFHWDGFPSDKLSPAERLRRMYDDWEHVNFWSEHQLWELMQLLGFKQTDKGFSEYLTRGATQDQINLVMSFKKL
jgi:predicted SAM-dependent methyltransferase